MMYGFIIAELIWLINIKKSPENPYYKQYELWIWGLIGGALPDLDGITGVVNNALFNHLPWTIDILQLYHRAYSHSLAFLGMTVILLIISIVIIRNQPKTNLQTLHRITPNQHKLPIYGFLIILITFCIFNYENYIWMNISFILILGSLVFFAWTLWKIKQPWIAVVFFLAAIAHQFCDMIQCEWNPFGPWASGIFWGLGLYCNGCGYCGYYGYTALAAVSNTIYWTWFTIFEIPPHIIVAIIVIVAIKYYYQNKRSQMNQIETDILKPI